MAMKIDFCNEDVSYIVPQKRKIRFWLMSVIEQEQRQAGDISCVFCSDDYLVKLNNQYLSASYFTDVITFDYSKKNFISGDIFISVDRVKENAKLYNQPYFREMCRVILHGILHLCGYKDKTETQIQQMREKEEYYLQKYEVND